MIVLDTSFLAGLYNTKDAHYESARAYRLAFTGLGGPAALLESVLFETMNVLLQRTGLAGARRAGEVLLGAPDIVFVRGAPQFGHVWKGFAAQVETRLSLTDVAIALYALEHAEGRVLSFDQEFRKVPGITLLPATK